MFLLLVISLTGALLSGCTQKAVSTEQPAINPEPPGFQEEQRKISWEGVLGQARKEGRVVIYGSPKPQTYTAIEKAFKNAYGITLEAVAGRAAEIVQKIRTEQYAGLYLADIRFGGAESALFNLKPYDLLADMDPLIDLPEVRAPKVWFRGSLENQYIDKERTALSFVAALDIPLAINTNLIKPEAVKSLEDLLDPRWKGKMIVNDPTTSGKGQQSFSMIGWRIRNWDFWRAIARQEPVVVRDIRLATDWLARGRYALLISPSTSGAQEFIEAGAPIKMLRFDGEGYVSASGGVVSVLKRAPHPKATQVFLNWLLTKEGQTIWSKEDGAQSARTDVATDFLDPIRVRDPKVKYYSTDDWEYISWRATGEDEKMAREIFGPLIK